MQSKVFSLITEEDLINTQIKSNNNSISYWVNVLKLKNPGSPNKDFINNINYTLASYFLSFDKREPNLRKKIEKKTKELLELINNDYTESLKTQIEYARKCISNIDKDSKISYSDPFKAIFTPFSPHNAKLKIIDQSLKESKLRSFKNDPTSLTEIRSSLLVLLNELDKLNLNTFNNKEIKLRPSAYIDEFNKLEQKQTEMDVNFIRELHKIYKAYTGQSDKFTYDEYNQKYKGKFFSLLKLCLEKTGKNISDDRISKLIGQAKL
jgi:hypothetical protein